MTHRGLKLVLNSLRVVSVVLAVVVVYIGFAMFESYTPRSGIAKAEQELPENIKQEVRKEVETAIEQSVRKVLKEITDDTRERRLRR